MQGLVVWKRKWINSFGECAIKIVRNAVYATETFADINEFEREIVLDLPSREVFMLLDSQFIYFKNENCIVSGELHNTKTDATNNQEYADYICKCYGLDPMDVNMAIKENEMKVVAPR